MGASLYAAPSCVMRSGRGYFGVSRVFYSEEEGGPCADATCRTARLNEDRF